MIQSEADQRRPFTMDRSRANHRGWRGKWGWEMGNAGPSTTQIATVCLAEKSYRGEGVVSNHWFAVHCSLAGNSKWEPGADILTGGGDDKK